MHLAIVGSREFTDYAVFSAQVDEYIAVNGSPASIVSGGARGVDTMAERYAKEHGIATSIKPAQWRVNGVYDRRAGFRRNSEIVAECTHAIAFPWVGSGGTQDTIRKLQLAGKPVKVIWVEPTAEK